MTKPKYLRLDDDVVKLVDDWRRGQSPIPSFNTAINTLLRDALSSTKVELTDEAFAELMLKLKDRPMGYVVYSPREVKEQ